MNSTALARPVHIPGPEHPITIEPNPARVRVTVAGQVVADSRRALTLTESSYLPVQYFPRSDVDMALLKPTTRNTYCPFKGEASYYSIPLGGEKSENAVWSYEEAYESVKEINGYLAFYPDCVDSIEELD